MRAFERYVSKALQQRLKYGGTLKEEHRKIILPTSWKRADKLFNKTPTLSERYTDKGMMATTSPT